MEPIRILYVYGGIMQHGGTESYMMNYYRNMNRNKIQIDFVVHGFAEGVYDKEIRQLGGKIYNIPVKSRNFQGNIQALRNIFKSGHYKIVHSHMDAMNAVVLREAQKCGIKVRIAHSHNTQHLTRNIIKYFVNEGARIMIRKYATNYFACSKAAGKWLFGKNSIEQNRVKIIHNAIDVNKYKNNKILRNKLRKKYGIIDNFVIGHVGRFDYQKNHSKLIEIFKEVTKLCPKAKLVLVGDGQLRNKIITKIKKYNLTDKVILLGERDDVDKIMNMFDIFLFPSHFEGLGIVLIEAQATGIYCVASDVISKETAVTDNIMYLPLTHTSREWAKKIININTAKINRDNKEKIIQADYSIEIEAEKLQSMYLRLQEYAQNESNNIN